MSLIINITIPGGTPDMHFSLPIWGFDLTGITVDWGDGSLSETITSSQSIDPTYGFLTHPYTAAGSYTVTVTGTYMYFGTTDGVNGHFNIRAGNTFITSVANWGDASSLNSLVLAFYNCTALISVPNTLPVSVTNTSGMFYNARAFNQPIDSWDVGNVTNMSGMFYYASVFKQQIGTWDVSNVTNMNSMFYNASAFNQPIDSWDVGNVTDMSYMFSSASAFNQPIGNWDVSNVTHMSVMFYGASAFNQPIGHWDVSSVMAMSGMFDLSGLSTYNYDKTLSGWVANSAITNIVQLNAGSIKYTTNAHNAHSTLTVTYFWTINDGGELDVSSTYVYPETPASSNLTSSSGNISVTLSQNIPAHGSQISYYMYSIDTLPFVPISPVTIVNGAFTPSSTIPSPVTYNNFTNLPNGTYGFRFITVDINGGYSDPTVSQSLTVTTSSVPCFDENTNILCFVQGLEKDILIKNLRCGDMVKTYKNGYKKIEMIGKVSFVNNPLTWERCMYKYRSKTENPLLLTGWHSILVDFDSLTSEEIRKEHMCRNNQIAMIDDKCLVTACNSDKFEKITKVYDVMCYHIVLESTDHNKIFGIWGNGMLAETISKYTFMHHHFTII
jgi:surface protein